ncbi:MAG: hypothetical protein EXR69_04740 [Myxococcales bacterium]|nr:hypothetical protein [Myxococcales bacterium]
MAGRERHGSERPRSTSCGECSDPVRTHRGPRGLLPHRPRAGGAVRDRAAGGPHVSAPVHDHRGGGGPQRAGGLTRAGVGRRWGGVAVVVRRPAKR